MEERLQKLLAQAGLCSRREAERWITDGRVTVNGRAASVGDKADLRRDKIMVDGPSARRKRGKSATSCCTSRAAMSPRSRMSAAARRSRIVLTLDSDPTYQQTGKPMIATTLAIRLVLDRAATTAEAVELLSKYDMFASSGRDYHFYITRCFR